MAILLTEKTDLSAVFEFAEGSLPFDLVDIINEAEGKDGKRFESAKGFFVYKTKMVVNDRKAALYDITGLRVSIYGVDTTRFSVGPSDLVEEFEIAFETQDEEQVTISQENLFNAIKATTFASSVVKVFSKQNALVKGADVVSTPATKNKKLPSLKFLSAAAKVNDIDPAALAAVGNFATQTIESAASLDSDSKNSTSKINSKVLSNFIKKPVSLRSTRSNSRDQRRGSQDNDISRKNDTLSVSSTRTNTSMFNLLPTRRLIDRDVYIDKSKLAGASKFYTVVTPILRNTKGRTPRLFSNITTETNHKLELIEFLSNPEPPEVEITQVSYSRVSFRVKRTDPTLGRVKVISIVTNPNRKKPIIREVGDVFFEDDNVAQVTANVDNVKPNKLTFRFVVVNGNGTVGEFTSVSVPTFKKITDPKNSAAVPASIFAANSNNGINITVDLLSQDIFSFRLLRQEIGKTGEFSDSVTTINNGNNEYETIVQGKKGARFLDKTAILGRKYRYFLAYRVGPLGFAGLSEEVLSDEDEVIIRRYPIESLPFEVSVSDPTLQNDISGLPSVSFDIDVTETREFYNAVISALRAAGVGEEFISELQTDKVRAKNFVMIIPERYEVSSGRRVSFGIRPLGAFRDDDVTRQALKIPAPQSGVSYKYIFKVCLQDPSVFLQTSDVALVNRYGKEIQKKASRFTRKVYDRLGILPAEADVKNGVSIEKIVEESQIGLEFVENVSIPARTPEIESIEVNEKTFYNSVTWSVAGRADDVSYFKVYVNVNGEKNLLGAIAPASDSSIYSFRDDRYHDAVGDKEYSVSAVSFTDDEFLSSPVAKSTKKFSIPDNMIVGAVFGSFGSKKKVVPIGPSKGGGHKSLAPYKPKKAGSIGPTPPGQLGPEDFADVGWNDEDFKTGESFVAESAIFDMPKFGAQKASKSISPLKPPTGTKDLDVLVDVNVDNINEQGQNQFMSTDVYDQANEMTDEKYNSDHFELVGPILGGGPSGKNLGKMGF